MRFKVNAITFWFKQKLASGYSEQFILLQWNLREAENHKVIMHGNIASNVY